MKNKQVARHSAYQEELDNIEEEEAEYHTVSIEGWDYVLHLTPYQV